MTFSKQPASHNLKDVAHHFVQKLPMHQRKQLAEAVSSAASEGRPLRVGTMCSGTDSPVVVFNKLSKALRGLNIEHTFSCEYNPAKQEWIKANFPNLEYLFGDVNELKTGFAFNHVDGEKVRVPAVDIVIAGFVCKSVSTENNDREKFANCIQEACGQTGETFNGVIGYVRKYKPSLVICENVKGLTMRTKDSAGNIQEPVIHDVAASFRKSGYGFSYSVLDSRDFFLPQRRNRCWMWAFKGSENQAAAEEALKTVKLLAEKNKPFKFTSLFRKAGVARCPIHRLNLRQKAVVKAALRKLPRADRHKDVMVDIAKSAERAPVCISAASCIVPNSMPYRVKSKTMFTPEQVNCVQGIYKEDFPALAKFAKEKAVLTRDLAGNAFSTTVCMAVGISCLVHAPLEISKPAPSTPVRKSKTQIRAMSPPRPTKRSMELSTGSPSKRLKRSGSV
mmetsp:Transcript_43589/g.81366  ORF Transcript_43589/g.81366 Transcript_43589/m.81366 type:complete len:449 (+) Transcript_43589:68-1414(+)